LSRLATKKAAYSAGIGKLESEVLSALEQKEQASAGEVLEVLRARREIAYSTVSTTLYRLFKKDRVDRRAMPGPGGMKYLFFPGKDERIKRQMVGETIDRLVGAFGDTAYSSLCQRIETLTYDKRSKTKSGVISSRGKKNRNAV